MMEENASTWIVHFFAKLCILGKHMGVEKIEGSCMLLPCLYPWSHFCSAHTNQIICNPTMYSFDVEIF